MAGNGRTVFAAGSAVSLTTASGKAVRERAIDNASTVSWTAGSLAVGGTHVWNNLPGSELVLTGNVDAALWFAPVPVFNNQGTVRRGGVSASSFDYNLNNTGLVEVTQGTLSFRQGYNQTAGELSLAGGAIGGNIAYAVSGGVVSGAGAFTGALQLSGSAEVRPGGPLGRLNLTGAFTAGNTAKSVFQLGGTTAGTDYDQIAATGALNLNGDLRIEFANGFTPGGEDTFTLLTGASRAGTFSATNAPAGYQAEVTYTGNSVVLKLVETGVVAPEITTQPVSLAVNEGQSATFTVVASGGGLTYQWRKGDQDLPGETSASLTFNPVQFSDAGTYSVVVANGGGSETSDPVTLTVNPSGIDSGLLARYAFEENLEDAVGDRDGTGTGTLTYVPGARGSAVRLNGSSWIRLGADSSLPIVDASRAFSVSFWIQPRAVQGMVPVRLATAGTEFALYLGTRPGDLGAYYFGFRGQPAVIATDADAYLEPNLGRWMAVTLVYNGGPKNQAASFRAYLNGTALTLANSGVIGGSANANELGRNEAGFSNFVNGDLDEVRVYERALRPEDAATLAENPPPAVPQIFTQPAPQLSVNLGQTINLSVFATGDDLRYQWFKDDDELTGETNSVLAIATAFLDDAGTYQVTVSNAFGSAVSEDSIVTVIDPGTPTGLLSRFGFDGTLEDLAGSFDGSPFGTVTYQDGVFGQSVRLNSSYLNFGANPSTPIINENQGFTVAYWFRPAVARTMVLHRLAGSVREFVCSVGATPQDNANLRHAVLFGFRGSLMLTTSAPELYLSELVNEWHHYAFVFRGGDKGNAANYEFWFDGVQVPLVTSGTTGGSFNANVFGANPGGAAAADGNVDELQIYGRPLTGTEIALISGDPNVPAGPQITTQPVGRTIRVGDPVTFAVAASGQGLTYQWRRNGIVIENAVSASYTIDDVSSADEGVYSVVVSNAQGSVSSAGARLWVLPVTAQGDFAGWFPFDGDITDELGLSFVSGGGTRLFYPGPRGNYLNFAGGDGLLIGSDPSRPLLDFSRPFALSFWLYQRQLADLLPFYLAGLDGDFQLRFGTGQAGSGLGNNTVSFGFGGQNALVSSDALAAVISNLGQWLQVAINYNGGPRNSAASYQLYLNGQLINLSVGELLAGTTGLNRFGGGGLVGGLDDVRLYNRVLTGAEIAGFSANPPQLPPDITAQPVDTANVLGQPVTLRVGAVGLPPFTYQWYRGLTLLTGQTAAEFTIPSLTLDDVGSYYAIIGNANGSVTSAPAQITVTLPPVPGLSSLTTGVPNFITSASFWNSLNGFISFRGLGGGAGGVRFTANGGQTWTVSNVGVTNDINAIRVVGSVAYIGGAGGLLCISTNSGASWTPFNTGTTETFNALAFSSSQDGWAVGTGGTICRYNGRSWVPFFTGLTVSFNGVAAVSGNLAWAVGSGGVICRYNGTAWEAVDTGTTVDFNAVAFLNANLGFAVGARGTICRYNGTAWVPLNTGTTGTFRNVAIVDASTIYASGDNGLFCVSRNGGDTWEPLGLGSASDLGGLAVNGGRLFLFGSGGAGFAFTAPGQVVNQPPTIRIISPTDDDQLVACRAYNVLVEAGDPDGTVARVEFFRGQFKLFETTRQPRGGQPWQARFNTDRLGVYELRAVATDNQGAVTVSAPVTIEVVPGLPGTAVAELYNDEEGCLLCFFGTPGTKWVLEGTEALSGTPDWSVVSTNIVTDPFLRVWDTNAVTLPQRFYRFTPVEE